MKKITVFLMLFATVLSAQVRVNDTKVLDLGNNAILPVFSEDGKYLLFNSMDGAKYHDLKNNETQVFAGTANDYSMDMEGKIRYRVDSFVNGMRMNSVLLHDSKLNETVTILDKKRLDIVPKITHHGIFYIEKEILKTDNTLSKTNSKPVVLSYNNGLLLYSYGTAKMMRPVGDDSFYIWPSVSPDNSMISFVDKNDLYVIDLNGNIKFSVKEARAPKWSPDGKWIAFMRDSDDGHVFTSSDIYIVRIDDQEIIRLTNTEDRIEMSPSWSPDGTQIVCEDAANDEFILLTLDIR
ncbi:MAG: hypothetical protein U9O95_00985 [Candidatus Marinimicrobia bacterium]|nr:hypothetical protein [Candidatus Neomarinimicrobiota bacterium]